MFVMCVNDDFRDVDVGLVAVFVEVVDEVNADQLIIEHLLLREVDHDVRVYASDRGQNVTAINERSNTFVAKSSMNCLHNVNHPRHVSVRQVAQFQPVGGLKIFFQPTSAVLILRTGFDWDYELGFVSCVDHMMVVADDFLGKLLGDVAPVFHGLIPDGLVELFVERVSNTGV